MGDFMLNDQLIELIRERPCLYNPNHSERNLYKVKEQQWSKIAKKLQLDVTFLKKRWIMIRNRYRKEWNANNYDLYKADPCSWRHYNQLSYLEPYMSSKTCTLLPKLKRGESQSMFVANKNDVSVPVVKLESESKKEPTEIPLKPQTIFEHTRLIEIVKTMLNLYDSQNYNSRHLTKIAWKQIAKELDATVDSVKVKWQGLRHRFRREYIKVIDSASSPAPYVSLFEYYDQLSFLVGSFNRNRSYKHDLKSEINYSDDLSDHNDRTHMRSHHSPAITTSAPNHSSNYSQARIFFDSIADQIEAENLPLRQLTIIQQEVSKVVDQQISKFNKINSIKQYRGTNITKPNKLLQ